MVDLAMSAEERKEYASPNIAGEERKYPYGLSITLDDGSLEKLKMTVLPAIGAKVTFTAEAVVETVSEYQSVGSDKERSVCLQITGLSFDASGGGDTAAKLYG